MKRTLSLRPEPIEVATARRFVAESLKSLGHDPNTATLLVSELVTNAVVHAETAIELTLCCEDSRITVEVHDDSDLMPTSRDNEPTAASGRGLKLISAVADEWGVRSIPGDGKVVWFALTPE